MSKSEQHDAAVEVEALAKELDELIDAPETPPTILTGAQMLNLIIQQHAALVADYQRWRILGRMSTIVGDHVSAKSQFDSAKSILERIVALRTIAAEEHLADEYQRFLDTWKTKQLETDRKAGNGKISTLSVRQ